MFSKKKVNRWCAKRKANVFPPWLISDWIAYQKWVRRQWRTASMQKLIRIDAQGQLRLKWEKLGENCAKWELVEDCSTKLVLNTKEAIKSLPIRILLNADVLHVYCFLPHTLRFSFACRSWISDIFNNHSRLRIMCPLNRREMFVQIAKLQLNALRKHKRLPPELWSHILLFAVNTYMPYDSYLEPLYEGQATKKKRLQQFQECKQKRARVSFYESLD